jgi:hypothetical protein
MGGNDRPNVRAANPKPQPIRKPLLVNGIFFPQGFNCGYVSVLKRAVHSGQDTGGISPVMRFGTVRLPEAIHTHTFFYTLWPAG